MVTLSYQNRLTFMAMRLSGATRYTEKARMTEIKQQSKTITSRSLGVNKIRKKDSAKSDYRQKKIG